MSVKYVPVQWNMLKWCYDPALLAATGLFLWISVDLAPGIVGHERPIAFGACAFLMLTVILCIGLLARLARRFLSLRDVEDLNLGS